MEDPRANPIRRWNERKHQLIRELSQLPDEDPRADELIQQIREIDQQIELRRARDAEDRNELDRRQLNELAERNELDRRQLNELAERNDLGSDSDSASDSDSDEEDYEGMLLDELLLDELDANKENWNPNELY